MTCTFFGHRECPKDIEAKLEKAITELIEKENVDLFYVGNQGGFDSLVKRKLSILKKQYPRINYYVVLAYVPGEREKLCDYDYENTVYPEELENVPKRYAINGRNMWMIKKSDFVVTCVRYKFGGAAKFKEIAEKRGKIIIEI